MTLVLPVEPLFAPHAAGHLIEMEGSECQPRIDAKGKE